MYNNTTGPHPAAATSPEEGTDMAHKVITISREFGTGARTIGQKLAAELGYAYYDRAIIQMAADKSGLSPDFIEKNEEKSTNSFLFNIATSAYISSGMKKTLEVAYAHSQE